MPRKSSAVVSPGKGGKCCCFCGLDDDNELDYGKIHEYRGIVTHYYCLLFSSNMQQRGLDEEGILGFLPGDIHKELKRGKRLVCSYCKKSGATLGCCNTKCKKIFHYPCGLRAGSLHQFFGEFRSYCIHHRPKQIIEDRILKELSQCEKKICYICYDEVNAKDDLGTIWAPCCKKNAWFHRTCVQQLAISAGYFFKCPLCNNKTEFQRAMLDHGIFIPSQDASWELVPNAFQELLYRHNRCDALKCVCPKGREYTSPNAKWELTLCRTCGSQGIHMACGNLKWGEPVWECNECTSILNKSMTSSNVSSRHGGSRVESNSSDEENSSDSEISVGNYTDGDSADSQNPSGELQSSLFFPKTSSVEEKSPDKQGRDDTDKTGSSKSPRKLVEAQKPRDDEEGNEELAPLTKKPKISSERETSKNNSDDDDDDVIVVSGPSRKEPSRAHDNSWVLHHYGKTAQTGEVTKQRQDDPAKWTNLLPDLSIVATEVSGVYPGSLTNSQVPIPTSNVEKPAPIEIDLSDSETWPIPTPSTSVNPKMTTNAEPSIPELNIQITNVTSLAPETFATASEPQDQPPERKEETGSVAGEPQNSTAKPVYQRLEIVRLDVSPATDNSPKPTIYGLTIPGTHNTVPLVFTRVEEPQSSPSSNQNNPPIPPSLSKLVGPKSRKAAILAAAASKNLANQPNAASIVAVSKPAGPALPNGGDISATLSSTSPTTSQNNEQPVTRKLAATPDSYSKTGQSREKGFSMVMRECRGNGNSPIATLVPTSTTQSSEYSAVSSPMSTAPQNQTNQRQTVLASHATKPTIQNNPRSNILTVTIGCDDEPSVIASKTSASTIRSEDKRPLLAPKPTIQSNDVEDRSKSSASKLSYSLPLEAVVNDQILQSCASKKLDTKKNVASEKTPSKQNTPGGTRPMENNHDPMNRINPTTRQESPPVTSKYFAQNVPANGFIPSRKIGVLTPKTSAPSSPNLASISSNSLAPQKVSQPAFPVGNTCGLQNPRSPGISAKDKNSPVLNRVQQNLETLQNAFDSVDSIATGSKTVSQPRKIPIDPHSENQKSPDTPKNCHGDAGTSLDVPPKRAVPADLKSNVRSHQSIDGTKDANDVNEKRRTEDVFRDDSQHDEEKTETTKCSTTRDRSHPADRIGLINRTINLRDLKFELCGSSIVKMTLYETYCVNMKIGVGKKRKSASCKNYEVPKKNCTVLSAERTDPRSLPRGCDILTNSDGLHGFSGSLTSSCFSSNSGENGAASQSNDYSQSNPVTKAPEIVSSDLTCGDGNSRGQDELKENLDPVPSSANVGTAGSIERKNKTRLRNGAANTMQLLNEQDVQEKLIDEMAKNSPRKIGNQVNSLGTNKMSSNERKEIAGGVTRNLFATSDEEANNSRCENMPKMCKMRGARTNEDEKMSERKSESPPKRAKFGKFEDPQNETSSVNNSGFDNLPFGHLAIAEKVRNRKSPRINNVCKNDKLHSNNGLKNGLKPSWEREKKNDNAVCCKVSIDLAKIQTVITNKVHFFEKTDSSEFHKSEKKIKRKKFEARSVARKFRSFDDLIIDQVYSSSIRIFSTVETRKWKSDDDLSRCSKLEDAFAGSKRAFTSENPRRSHEQNTLSFEKHDCVR